MRSMRAGSVVISYQLVENPRSGPDGAHLYASNA